MHLVAIFAWQMIRPGYLYYNCERLILWAESFHKVQGPHGTWNDNRGIYQYKFDESVLTIYGTPFEGSSKISKISYRTEMIGTIAHLRFSRVHHVSGQGDFSEYYSKIDSNPYREMFVKQESPCAMSIVIKHRRNSETRHQLICSQNR